MSKLFRYFLVIVFLLGAGCSATPASLATSTAATLLPQKTPELLQQATLPPTDTAVPAPTNTPAPTEPAQPSPTAPPSPAITTVISPTLVQIDMLDESNGWGLSDHNILRTEDGGSHWIDVTPKEITVTVRPSSFFLDKNTAWALTPRGQDFGAGILSHTGDGGKTWSLTQVPFSGGYLDFLDAQHGWSLDASDCGAGSCGGKLYQTQDGGNTWTVATIIDPNDANAPGRLPFSGDKSGVTFLDLTHGWATGSIPMDNYAWLFASLDGGKTWQHQDLALPQGISTSMLGIDPPRFFNAQDGILPVNLFASDLVKDFYVTHDGGKTWAPTRVAASGGVYSIVSMQDLWVWNGGTLYVTHDGAQNWTPVTPNVDLSQTIAQLDFVSKDVGWVLNMDANGVTQLLKTTDGGATWKPVP